MTPVTSAMGAKLALILGGTRSGKSRFAEAYAASLGKPVRYVATAEPKDEEMRRRIALHRRRRPKDWRMLEVTREVARAIAEVGKGGEVVLIDCLTLLVANLLNGPEGLEVEKAVTKEIKALLSTCRSGRRTLIVVSNEVGMGVVPPFPLGRLKALCCQGSITGSLGSLCPGPVGS